jgi:hypothetical protein
MKKIISNKNRCVILSAEKNLGMENDGIGPNSNAGEIPRCAQDDSPNT